VIWLGIILLVIGGVLAFLSTRGAKRAHFIKATQTSKAGELLGLVKEIAQDLPPGMGGSGYKDYVQIKGKVVCDEPLRGELSDTPAAIFETKVERIVERQEQRRDSQGNYRTHWTKRTESLSSNRREAVFYVDDGTGRLRVKPGGKSVDLIKVVDRFEAPGAIEQMSGGNLNVGYGRFRMSVGAGFGGGSRTVGYKFEERILPVGQHVYILAEAADTDDEGLVLRPPTDEQKDRPFLLSTKTEEELIRSTERSSMIQKVAGAVLVLGGLAALIVGLVN